MNFKYDSLAHLEDKSRYINVEQIINPFTMDIINNYEDAEKWMRQFLLNEYNAQPLFFLLEISDLRLVKNKSYKFKIVENSGRLTGAYKISFVLLNSNEEIEIDTMFTDGEAEFEYFFNIAGDYELAINNDFFIGQDKYISIVTENNTRDISLTESINNFKFKIEDK